MDFGLSKIPIFQSLIGLSFLRPRGSLSRFRFEHIMSYQGMTVAQRMLARQQWAAFDDLARFVRNYQYVGFHVKANRDRIRDAYLQLRGPAPFSRTVRFPEDTAYVHLANGNLRVWVEQLLHSLDLPDRQIEKGRAQEADMSLADAKRAFDVAFSHLARIVDLVDEASLAENGVYFRESFEEAFGFHWA